MPDDAARNTPSPEQRAVATALMFADNGVISPDATAGQVRDLVDRILLGLRSLPVEQRMEAMGMRKATWDDIDSDLRSPVWVEGS